MYALVLNVAATSNGATCEVLLNPDPSWPCEHALNGDVTCTAEKCEQLAFSGDSGKKYSLVY